MKDTFIECPKRNVAITESYLQEQHNQLGNKR